MTTSTLTILDIADLDDNLAQDISDDPEGTIYELYEDTAHAGDAPNAALQILWIPEILRAGIVYTGSGSSGMTTWTDASSPEDALRRYVEDDIRN